MLCTNKQYLYSCVSLYNEKLFFKFDTDVLSRYRDLFIRLYFIVSSYPESNAVFYSLLSMDMLLPKPSVRFFSIDARRFITKYVIERRRMLRVFPYIFFSYMHNNWNAQYAYVSSSKWPRRSKYCNNIGFSFNCRSVSNISYFYDYFYGIVDADLKYNIRIVSKMGLSLHNVIALRLFCSLLCIPFTNLINAKYK